MTADKPFVHLHVHTEFSLLDGLSKIPKLVGRAKELEMSSLAITDHGTMFGVIPFYRACQEAGIKPIIGVESYLAHVDRHIRDQSEKQPYHLLLLAKNATGYKNLLKLASEAQLTGFYGKPRVDKDLLAAHSEGLICTSGCLAAEIPRAFGSDNEQKALDLIGTYQDIFGKENFFLELQNHDIPEIHRLNEWLIRKRGVVDVPLVATNDVHYVLDSDFAAHDTLLCIQTGTRRDDAKRMRMTDPSYHLRSADEMWALFGDSAPSALTNTLLVAEMCELDLSTKGYHLPVFPVPQGYTADSYLRVLAMRGAEWRFGSDAPKFQERLDYELGVINRMGFDTYFLIVWDLTQFARHADIWWNVRGSGAGSAVAYCLGITNIDPIRNNLIFERFLNPGRVSMPDIDVDFPDDRRMEMIEYAKRKYGEDKVAAIITFSALKARAAIKDVARVLDYPLADVNKLTALVPQIPSKPVTLAQCLGDDPEYAVSDLKKVYREDDAIRDLLDTALTVEGVTRHVGTHAAGIIISDRPLVEYIPLHRPTTSDEESVPIKAVTQFPMEICESIGLLKVDFLGLSTLTIMRKACELIERYHGITYTMDNIPYRPSPDDPTLSAQVEEAFKLIGSGEVTGVFQLEGQGMRKMLVDMKPKTFEHITAAISLYRPGPLQFIPTYIKRMHNEEPIEYLHPRLEPILRETMGICVYQEQIQQIAASLFGYSLGDADLMRRAVSKKKAKDLNKHKEIFMEKGPENGVSGEIAEKIFDQVEYFAAYGFNKSHAADYAVLTCQTAFLKAHYAAEYYIALLTVQRDVTEDVALFTSDCRRLGIPILPPSINASDLDFTIEEANDKRCIRFGLGAIKFVGAAAAEEIAAERARNGSYKSLVDICRRVDLRPLGKRGLESLIKAGAFDSFGRRDVLVAAIERMVNYSTAHHKAKGSGQFGLFTEVEEMESDQALFLKTSAKFEPVSQRDMLRWEKELIGLYISDHPLNALATTMAHLSNLVLSSELKKDGELYHNKQITVAALVVSTRTLTTKNGDAMAIVSLEDVQGNIEAVCFPRTWAKYRELIKDDQVFIVRGKADTQREGSTPQIIVDSFSQEFDIAFSADDASASNASKFVPAIPDRKTRTPPPTDDHLPADGMPDEAFAAFSEPPEDDNPSYADGLRSDPNTQPAISPTNGHHAEAMPATQPTVPLSDTPSDDDLTFDPFEDFDALEKSPMRQVTVTFDPPSGDRKLWMRKIKHIHDKAIEKPGHDLLVFRFPEEGRILVMEFTDSPIDYEAALPILSQYCPPEHIRVEQLGVDSLSESGSTA